MELIMKALIFIVLICVIYALLLVIVGLTNMLIMVKHEYQREKGLIHYFKFFFLDQVDSKISHFKLLVVSFALSLFVLLYNYLF